MQGKSKVGAAVSFETLASLVSQEHGSQSRVPEEVLLWQDCLEGRGAAQSKTLHSPWSGTAQPWRRAETLCRGREKLLGDEAAASAGPREPPQGSGPQATEGPGARSPAQQRAQRTP